MRRFLISCTLGLFALSAPLAAFADSQRDQEKQQQQQKQADADKEKKKKDWDFTPAPLKPPHAAGPCPFVKVLYDAARYVEFDGAKESTSTVAWTGEIEGIKSDCSYKENEPITVDMGIGFSLGRGPMAKGDFKDYRYWVAVTERNKSVLAKTYFTVPVKFVGGDDRVSLTDRLQRIVIPRGLNVSGSNFEILVGFDVTPAQAEFNRDGKRFKINAVSQVAQADPQTK